jgi:hypothetical protein
VADEKSEGEALDADTHDDDLSVGHSFTFPLKKFLISDGGNSFRISIRVSGRALITNFR